jgi:hypothetical protein
MPKHKSSLCSLPSPESLLTGLLAAVSSEEGDIMDFTKAKEVLTSSPSFRVLAGEFDKEKSSLDKVLASPDNFGFGDQSTLLERLCSTEFIECIKILDGKICSAPEGKEWPQDPPGFYTEPVSSHKVTLRPPAYLPTLKSLEKSIGQMVVVSSFKVAPDLATRLLRSGGECSDWEGYPLYRGATEALYRLPNSSKLGQLIGAIEGHGIYQSALLTLSTLLSSMHRSESRPPEILRSVAGWGVVSYVALKAREENLSKDARQFLEHPSIVSIKEYLGSEKQPESLKCMARLLGDALARIHQGKFHKRLRACGHSLLHFEGWRLLASILGTTESEGAKWTIGSQVVDTSSLQDKFSQLPPPVASFYFAFITGPIRPGLPLLNQVKDKVWGPLDADTYQSVVDAIPDALKGLQEDLGVLKAEVPSGSAKIILSHLESRLRMMIDSTALRDFLKPPETLARKIHLTELTELLEGYSELANSKNLLGLRNASIGALLTIPLEPQFINRTQIHLGGESKFNTYKNKSPQQIVHWIVSGQWEIVALSQEYGNEAC